MEAEMQNKPSSGLNDMPISTLAEAVVDDRIDYLTFLIGEDEFGIDFKHVHDISEYRCDPASYAATVSIKKKVRYHDEDVNAIDLRKRASLEAESDAASLIVLGLDGGQQGFVVDQVTGICRIAQEEIVPVPATISNVNYFIGLAQNEARMVILVHADLLAAKFALQQPQELPFPC